VSERGRERNLLYTAVKVSEREKALDLYRRVQHSRKRASLSVFSSVRALI
jgi:hypothetical protein